MWKMIGKAGFIAGSLDISAAYIHAFLRNGTSFQTILHYIASGLVGPNAYEGGISMAALGLIIHYCIAFSCSIVYFFAYPRIAFLKYNLLVSACCIGFVAWLVTTQLIVPFSRIGARPFDLVNALIAIAILIVCVGLPIAIAAKLYFNKK